MTTPPRHVKQLWFTPYAWAKLLFMCHWTEDEVGAMGLANADDPFLIEDLWIPKQVVGPGSTKFDMDDFAQTQMTLADPASPDHRHPRCFRRVWIHTHPEGIHTPSPTDDRTFKQIVGNADWGVMFIMAKDGVTYCQMRVQAGGVQVDTVLPVGVAWGAEFPESNQEAWDAELETNTAAAPPVFAPIAGPKRMTSTSKLVATPKVYVSPPTPPAAPKHQLNLDWMPGLKPKRAARALRILAYSESILSGISSRQMTLLLTSHATVGDLTPATMIILEKAGVTITNKNKVPTSLIAEFTHKDLLTPTSSPGLLGIDRQQVLLTSTMLPADRQALEDDLLAVAADRVVGVAGQTDSNEEPLEVAYPWLAHDGTVLLLSNDEIGSLLDELGGKFVNEVVSRGASVGFELDDAELSTAADTLNQLCAMEPAHRQLQNDGLEWAIKEITTIMTEMTKEGQTVVEIEDQLTKLAMRASAVGWLPEAIHKIKQLRDRGYRLMPDVPALDDLQQVNNELLLQQDERSDWG